MAEKKKKIYFDIVNSVKGGSGKSTVSLLLAAYFSSKEECAYIIDLDLRGTSWETNYKDFICPPGDLSPHDIITWEKNKRKCYPYINNLLWDFEKYENEGIWADIHIKTESHQKQPVHLCLGKTDNGHIIDQVEEDLFENTVFQIIRGVVHELLSPEGGETIHILLDMPPSYERHAERVVEHILLSENSRLVNLLNNKRDDIDYCVTFYMISAVAPAHFAQNAHYIKHFFQKQSYSGRAFELSNNNKLCVRSIINDVAGVVDKTTGITEDDVKKEMNNEIAALRGKFARTDINPDFVFQNASYLPHIKITDFKSLLRFFKVSSSDEDLDLVLPLDIQTAIKKMMSDKP